MTRVVVTGLGITTALGHSIREVWPRLLAGASGIGRIQSFDASRFGCQLAAEVLDIPEEPMLSPETRKSLRRGVSLFIEVVRECWVDSGMGSFNYDERAIGVAAGTSVNYVQMELLEQYHRFRAADSELLDLDRFEESGLQPADSFSRRLGDSMSTLPAKLLGLRGPNLCLDAACSASLFSVAEAYRVIRRGHAKAMIAGGSAALVGPNSILAFDLIRALSRNCDPATAVRPFDGQRDGFILGEGAGAILLEELEHARARGARIYGEVAGFGSSLNAHNLTDPSPEGEAEFQALKSALDDARMNPDEIDYVAAHGTSTPKNDAVETAAIKRVFGESSTRLMVSSNKAQIGHTISAAGVCNLIVALKAIEEGRVPPTMNYSVPDPECDLDYVVNESRSAKVRGALVNAFAFGGQNAVMALREL